MSAKFSLLIGSGLVAAGVVWAQSTVIVYERRAPGRAAMIGIPPQGWTKASLSHALQGARLVKNPESAPGSLERQLAQEAFAAEPLATPALSVLIQSLAADGNQRKSERLIELAAELSRRDNLVNAMQIDEALKRKQTQRAMGLLGRAMSVDYEVRYMYLERMAAGTASAGASDVLVPMLGRNPKWSLDYWNAVLRVPNALVRAGEIRRRIAGTPWNVNNPSKTDFELIAELAKRGHPALARDIASSLGMSATSTGELLAGSMFNHQPRFVPFEWELLQTGDVGATIDSKAGFLAISSLPGASGVVARQLIEISAPGVYRLRWSLAGLAANPDALLKFRLTCAEPTRAGPPIAPITIGEGNGSAVLTIPTSSCAWYGATLEFGAQSSSVGTDIAIERLSLRRE